MSTAFNQDVARALLAIGAVGFSPDEPITFKSGIISPVYVDNRRLPYHPAQWHTVIEAFSDCIAANHIAYDVIAGVAVGGVPHSSALAYHLQQPSVFVRKEAKEHGKKQRVEGGEVADKRVLLVEDLVTTGGSSLNGIEALRESGAMVTDLIAIVSYEFSQSAEAFAQAGITFHALTDFATILQIAEADGLFNAEQGNRIRDWFNAPESWAERHGIA
ncbi:orotate phosphoribosyltransferase [Phototrophicus methaneseepsis]|uniref:Orotate phosphoribosyltransferase n=1 Tax=Phototrophicus methaneseepsis TaxID=2710758 RepID=A0A7S8E6U1_9CHLR|nr:orotate phosphoribosyltransferase [Phototrophicus methaneseepsis]QPC81394.1 orotate phosphoribosyltransferase [Phototrophicus methaneseepsis]